MNTVHRVTDGGVRPASPERVWYASYGSNMHAERLRHYLAGGRPPGAARTYAGCRDPSPPLRSVAVELPGTVYFATHSPVWSGARAFYDPDAAGTPGAVWGRAHLITPAQFSDIAAQEMYGSPGRDLDLSPAFATGRLRIGPGRYETLLCPGDLDGFPLLTFTAPWRVTEVPWSTPSAAYLAHLASGLLQTGAWSLSAVCAYLAARPGAAGHWTAGQVAALLDPSPEPGPGSGPGAGPGSGRSPGPDPDPDPDPGR